MIYFDNSASTPLIPAVKAAFLEEMEYFANPSSLHRLGFEAEQRMKKARSTVAATLMAREDEIVFTAGGTEADNLGILGAAEKMRRRGNRILSTNSEHPAVEECLKHLEADGFEVIRLSTKGGALNLDEVREAANDKTILAAVMHTNNETGAVYDIAALSRIVKGKNPACLVFCDAVQGYGKSLLIPGRMGIDLMAISSHKIHGPKGVGALYVKKGIGLLPLLLGGGQERGLRSGTENLPGIVAFAKACEIAHRDLSKNREKMNAIRSVILKGFEGEARVKFHLPASPSPHVLSMEVAGFRSEVLLHTLSEKEVFVSSGSACSSHKGRSAVLENFGVDEKGQDRTIRLSFSSLNTSEEGEAFVSILKELLR